LSQEAQKHPPKQSNDSFMISQHLSDNPQHEEMNLSTTVRQCNDTYAGVTKKLHIFRCFDRFHREMNPGL
jgi:hypothetical protein